MNARDELTDVILATKNLQALRLEIPAGIVNHVATGVADAIAAAGYRRIRTITTVEELDGLPNGAAVLDRYGDISTKQAHWWHGYETAPLFSSKLVKFGPLAVIHEGAKP